MKFAAARTLLCPRAMNCRVVPGPPTMTQRMTCTPDRDRVELTRSYRGQRDGGDAMQRATVDETFRLLQQGGLIPREANLETNAPDVSVGERLFGGGSYRDRLSAMVRDRDANGRYDLDLGELSRSGVLSRSASVDELDRTLGAGARMAPLTRDFFEEQDARRSISSLQGVDAGALAQSRDLTFRRDGAPASPLDDLPGNASRDPQGVSSAAIARAQLQSQRGDPGEGARTLREAGDALTTAHSFEQARTVYAELQRRPYASQAVDLLPDEPHVTRQGTVMEYATGGNTTRLDSRRFESTCGTLATQRLAQLDVDQRMDTALGGHVDARDPEVAARYFQQFGRTHDTAAVRDEYSSWLRTHFAHAGGGVDWDPSVDVDRRPAQVGQLLASQPIDGEGRRVIDCEGFTYLNERVLGGVTDAQGRQRFAVVHGGRPGHVLDAVVDRGTGQGFVVNNEAVSPLHPTLDETRRDFATQLGPEGWAGLRPSDAAPLRLE